MALISISQNPSRCPDEGTPLAQIGMSSQTLWLTEGTTLSPGGIAVNPAGGVANMPAVPHRGVTNIAYLDGHTGNLSAQYLAKEMTNWNTAGTEGIVLWNGSLRP